MNIFARVKAAGVYESFRDTRIRGIVASAVILFSTSAMAGTSAGYGMGGQFTRFDPVVSQYNQSGELFRIEGHCQSACTLFLGIRNVCVERTARLLFHAGHDRNKNINSSSTSHMLGTYNPQLSAFVLANHSIDPLDLPNIPDYDII